MLDKNNIFKVVKSILIHKIPALWCSLQGMDKLVVMATIL